MADLSTRVKTKMFTAMMSLPPRWQRRLAGPPKRIDGLTLSTQTQLMLKLQRWAREKPVESLSVEKGRRALLRQTTLVGGDLPIGRVEDRKVAGAEGELKARLYVPKALLQSAAPDPLLVFFHGGGMIYGDLDSHDSVCRFLAEEAGVRVLAVDYRLAPETRFPGAADDAWAAFAHVAGNAAEYGGDPARLAVGGDSAGGALSAITAIRAAEEGVPLRFQLLIYPTTDASGSFPSRETFGRELFLTTEFMELATSSYIADADPKDPRASVLYAEIPETLAPAYVSTAGFDPLRDEGEAYVRKLEDAGVEVTWKRYGGEIHGFANVLSVDGNPKRAMAEHAAALREALGPAPGPALGSALS
jgi:acetyl esterase